ncbi:adenosine deaminase [Ferrovibrio sp.]|uniref:adenosine deaminase n=1 Tax=Ferrovibrio sp. TaxID=1917215 RepID=UPI0025B9EF77|nr:adenosine deaminase [Ferrovibrio sp.]MBX3455979.1 adenosine deaminase [Ferrovibrio sp.]
MSGGGASRVLHGASLAAFVQALPKAELHLHIEGSLEPELLFRLASRNGVRLAYADVESLRAAYDFHDLQSFLTLYYQGAAVLREAVDFHELALDYMARAAADTVRHTEIFFDPQTHTGRGLKLETVMEGLLGGLNEGARRYGVSWALIPCFLRDLSEQEAFDTLELLLPWRQHFKALGLDSAERAHPPSKFQRVFARAADHGLPAVAHAGEEGPPSYITEALDLLKVVRIDHGVRAVEDAAVMQRLAREGVPLTVCPLSNLKLKVFSDLRQHSLRQMLRAGLCCTINSDDPAYFGGYVAENYRAIAEAQDLTREDLLQLARNSFTASFLPSERIAAHLAELDAFAAAN